MQPSTGAARRWHALTSDGETAGRLRAALAADGIAVVEVAAAASPLEALFLDLTRSRAAS